MNNAELILTLQNLRGIYRESPFHDTVSAAVDRLNRNLGSGGDRRIIVLIGDPGAGKSRTIREVLHVNAVLGNQYRAFECPSPCTVGAMGATLLKHLGHLVVRDSFRDHSLVDRIEAAIPHSGVRVVLIDEAQHTLNSASELKLTRCATAGSG